MADQMPGELIYEYDGLRITSVTSYGAPPFEAVMSGAGAIPPSGAWYDFTLEGRVSGPRLRGTVQGVDHIQVRPDGRAGLHLHAEITTDDGKKIALFADGRATFPDGPPLGDLRENVALTTAEPGYEWVNALQIWAVGTFDVITGRVEVAGYAV
ncbi:MAG: DUF3237 family protein [Streptosporangiaceae bacterium]